MKLLSTRSAPALLPIPNTWKDLTPELGILTAGWSDWHANCFLCVTPLNLSTQSFGAKPAGHTDFICSKKNRYHFKTEGK
jgi:hypothetical protein